MAATPPEGFDMRNRGQVLAYTALLVAGLVLLYVTTGASQTPTVHVEVEPRIIVDDPGPFPPVVPDFECGADEDACKANAQARCVELEHGNAVLNVFYGTTEGGFTYCGAQCVNEAGVPTNSWVVAVCPPPVEAPKVSAGDDVL